MFRSEKANFWLTRGRLSPRDARQSIGGYRAMIKNLQPCPKWYLLIHLAPCCTATGGLERVYQSLSLRYKPTSKRMRECSYGERRGQFPRMRIRIRAGTQYAYHRSQLFKICFNDRKPHPKATPYILSHTHKPHPFYM